MSQVIAAYSASWIALSGDRGMTWIDSDGTKQRGLHRESKLQTVPGLPVVFAATGPAYASEVIASYIAHKFDPAKRRTELANEIWAELCAYHKERMGSEVATGDVGLMHQYDLDALTRASMSMLFADARGVAGVFVGEYPSPEPRCVSIATMGNLIGHGSGIVGIGVHNFDWKVNVGRMGATGAVDLVRSMTGTVDAIEMVRSNHDGDALVITPPHDIVLLSSVHNGAGGSVDQIEWIERAEVAA